MVSPWKIELQARAREAGFLDVRTADARPNGAAAAGYRDWVSAGNHGEMAYLERLMDERTCGLDHVLPGARAIVMFAASYYHPAAPVDASHAVALTSSIHPSKTIPSPHPDAPVDPSHHAEPVGLASENSERSRSAAAGVSSDEEGTQAYRIARYALGVDYHYVLKERLAPLVEWLDSTHPGHEWRVATDSAPIMERTYAAASGLGFIGKNGMLITWLQGSFTLLASIVTTAPLEIDGPRGGTCGQCTRCLDACPTQAFIGPGKLDSRKCISYLTIEKKTELSLDEAAATGDWVFGCDICQEVCPYNKSPERSLIEEFTPGRVVNRIEPAETFLGPESNGQFERRFAGSPILRAGRRRVQRLVKLKG